MLSSHCSPELSRELVFGAWVTAVWVTAVASGAECVWLNESSGEAPSTLASVMLWVCTVSLLICSTFSCCRNTLYECALDSVNLPGNAESQYAFEDP